MFLLPSHLLVVFDHLKDFFLLLFINVRLCYIYRHTHAYTRASLRESILKNKITTSKDLLIFIVLVPVVKLLSQRIALI